MRCPERGHVPMSMQLSGEDHWVADRWTKDKAVADKKIAEFYAKYPPGSSCSPIADYWPWDTPVARVCSFCGGVHPEDAIMLLQNGWRVECTGKSYKRYLNPPDDQHPVPPVKLYMWHLSELDCRNLNKLIQEGPKAVLDTI